MSIERDECLYELQLAIIEAEKIVELDMFQVISEKDDDNVKATQFDNENHKNAAIEHIKSVIHSIMDAISKMLANIGNFIHKLGMSKEDKDMFAAYEEACKKDPNFKNKTIRVRDFNKQRAAYEKVIGEANAADKRLSRGEFVDMNRLINNWSNTISDAAGAVAKSVTMEYAMNMAKSNMNYARLIEGQLGEDSKIMQSISASLGAKEANKFKKDIHTYTNRCAGRRFVLKLRGKLFDSAEDCAMDIINGVKAAINNNYPGILNSSALGAGIRAYKGNENVRKLANEGNKISKSIKKGQFDAAVHNATKPARDAAGKIRQADTAVRRKLGDYSDAPLINLDGDGVLQRQAKKTGKELSKAANAIRNAVGKAKY